MFCFFVEQTFTSTQVFAVYCPLIPPPSQKTLLPLPSEAQVANDQLRSSESRLELRLPTPSRQPFLTQQVSDVKSECLVSTLKHVSIRSLSHQHPQSKTYFLPSARAMLQRQGSLSPQNLVFWDR